jgi:hypothetical protein
MSLVLSPPHLHLSDHFNKVWKIVPTNYDIVHCVVLPIPVLLPLSQSKSSQNFLHKHSLTILISDPKRRETQTCINIDEFT